MLVFSFQGTPPPPPPPPTSKRKVWSLSWYYFLRQETLLHNVSLPRCINDYIWQKNPGGNVTMDASYPALLSVASCYKAGAGCDFPYCFSCSSSSDVSLTTKFFLNFILRDTLLVCVAGGIVHLTIRL